MEQETVAIPDTVLSLTFCGTTTADSLRVLGKPERFLRVPSTLWFGIGVSMESSVARPKEGCERRRRDGGHKVGPVSPLGWCKEEVIFLPVRGRTIYSLTKAARCIIIFR